MKLERRDIRKVSKLLTEIPYRPVKESHYIAVLIQTDKVKEFDGGIELTITNKEQGVKKPAQPVLVMHSSENNPVILGYADISYARAFDIMDYCDLLGVKLSKGFEILQNLEIVMIHKDNLLMGFEL